MSDRLYTCDICIREGHEDIGCHYPNELTQVGESVVCEGCLDCGAFPELDDLPQSRFIPPEDKRIDALEKVAEAAAKLIPLCELVADEEIELDNALREAGYLKGEGE